MIVTLKFKKNLLLKFYFKKVNPFKSKNMWSILPIVLLNGDLNFKNI